MAFIRPLRFVVVVDVVVFGICFFVLVFLFVHLVPLLVTPDDDEREGFLFGTPPPPTEEEEEEVFEVFDAKGN